MTLLTSFIVWLIIILIVWSLICLLFKSRDTSSVNNAAQLETIFAPCLSSSTLGEADMIKQLDGLDKLKTLKIQWITVIPSNTSDITDLIIQQNHLRFSTLMRMSHPESQIHVIHNDLSSIPLSTWNLESSLKLHTEEQDVKSLVDLTKFDIVALFDLKHSLFALPVLLNALAEHQEWDIAVFHPQVVLPATFGCSTVKPWWIRKMKNRDEWFSRMNMNELQMSSRMVWFKSTITSLPNVLTPRSLIREAKSEGNDYRIVDYESSCLISAKTAYESY